MQNELHYDEPTKVIGNNNNKRRRWPADVAHMKNNKRKRIKNTNIGEYR